MLQDPSSAFRGRRDQPLNYTVTHWVSPALSHSGGLRLLEIDVTGVRIVNFLVRAAAIWNAAIREKISHISAFHVSVWLYQSPVRSDLVLTLCVTMLVWFLIHLLLNKLMYSAVVFTLDRVTNSEYEHSLILFSKGSSCVPCFTYWINNESFYPMGTLRLEICTGE